ncbi:chemotaxis signal transduction protein [Rivularia sp. PCC 7116]|uniref:chemotaxis protein CheW n=1 Tax=Rivularia sp. PCC 7116 TaxID=373994 RepID=UPI00029EE2A8|nr:chemotaxis protein CheW [Rivularia sp. PCC 7116]AFY56030.1 chemotaxis signal transduction protein [Rivularia sp. PCC 7116]
MNASNIKLLTQPQKNLGDGYLQFELNQNTAAVLLVNFIQEVAVLPLEAITSIPNTSEPILGLMSWRNRIIWVVDLPNILGFESQFYRMGQCNIIVISHQKETIGLMVPEIRGTVRFNSGAIQPPDSQDSHIVPYLNGCIWHENELNLLLNIQAILKSSFLHVK